ncbi:MAG: TolC family protein, partial [candidate division WOR-3 bacterium]|nr:TolC family protein [candidate division WOR-3 bacterium]
MKLIRFLLLVIIFSAITKMSVAGPLTLDDCIKIAKENNLELRQARLNIENARMGLAEANADYYPNIGLTSGYRAGGNFSNRDITSNYSSGVSMSY